MRRPTITDIARRAGLTKTAVSFALNGQPGVSEDTRRRVLDIAQEIGWQPHSAARALSDGRANAFGLVIDRPARMLGVEPFFMQLIAGIQGELADAHISLLFTVAQDQDAEIELYRSWWAQRRVDGVFLVNLQVDDRRVDVLAELRLPTLVIGSAEGAGDLPAVWFDEDAAVRTVVEHLVALGHRRIARVTGIPGLWHTKLRTDAFLDAASGLGVTGVCAEGDYTQDSGVRATRELLESAQPPTAIVYDNDIMAISGALTAQRMGRRLPADLSIVAWDDSPLCELVHPALTALHRDIGAHGAHAARRLMDAERGVTVGGLEEAPYLLVRRGSTGPAPAPAG
ncbi:MAG TPA: LacI family DNA-binding transcriptional regulator [Pseudonocardiaceae bacterium]|jgi:DNA-binding LacI/PurR family transcriptional regulator|nr:LacI family DNA-binding transcriptional regulator [Pseudonocardiaceae bacterium]